RRGVCCCPNWRPLTGETVEDGLTTHPKRVATIHGYRVSWKRDSVLRGRDHAGPVRQRQQQGGTTHPEHRVAGGPAQAEAARPRGDARRSEDSTRKRPAYAQGRPSRAPRPT